MIGKSIVALTKYVSIPSLELTKAILSIKMSQLMQKELEPENESDFTEYF